MLTKRTNSRLPRWVSTAGPGLALILAVAISFLVGESVARRLGEVDINGTFHLRGYWVRPRALPKTSVEQALDAYRSGSDVILEYDRSLGWRPRPSSQSRDGLYRYNASGLRADREYPYTPPEGTIRIAVFGDSFVHGDDVAFGETFLSRTESILNSSDIDSPRVEILNFGVRGYGLGQALLLFEQEAAQYQPDVVILGVQPENLKRITNVIRPFYYPLSGLPFSKPRLRIEDGSLVVVNVPCIPPEAVLEAVRDPSTFDLASYEGHYDPRDYRGSWWRRSRLLSFTADVAEQNFRPPVSAFDLDSENARIGLRIIEQFESHSEEIGATFLAFHLPTSHYLNLWAGSNRFEYQEVLDEIRSRVRFLSTERALVDASEGNVLDLFDGYHYTARGHDVLAQVLAAHLEQMLGSISGEPVVH